MHHKQVLSNPLKLYTNTDTCIYPKQKLENIKTFFVQKNMCQLTEYNPKGSALNKTFTMLKSYKIYKPYRAVFLVLHNIFPYNCLISEQLQLCREMFDKSPYKVKGIVSSRYQT